MTTIFQVLGAVLVLFFIFLTYMSAKTWRWVHVTFLFLVFVASVTFCVYAAMTLKTRAAWVKLHDSLEKQLATTDDDLLKTTRGDPKDFEGTTDSLYSVREAMGRTILDRGRVWRGCFPNIDRRTGAIVVQTSPPPDPTNPTPAPPKKHNIQPKTIVHVFREGQPAPPDGPILPVAYVGEFRVTQVNDQAVALEPTIPPTPEQAAAGLTQGTWALYESMPVDGHEWFTGTDQEKLQPLQFAASLERQSPQVQQAFGQIAEQYKRDGTEVTSHDNFPPEDVWYEVTFEKEFEVDVDAAVVNSIDAEPFNTEGQSVLPRLRRGGETPEQAGKVKFGPGEGQIHTAVVDSQTAEALISQEICDPVKTKKIYRRKLNDYERRFRSINDRMVELAGRLKQVELDKKAMEATTAKSEQQYALVEELKAKANEDLAKVKYEVAEMEKYTAALSGRLSAVQGELSQLYRANKAIGRELAELTARLTEDINRRTREATALAAP